eukprot:4721342-Karenia_brevis.AAC.1
MSVSLYESRKSQCNHTLAPVCCQGSNFLTTSTVLLTGGGKGCRAHRVEGWGQQTRGAGFPFSHRQHVSVDAMLHTAHGYALNHVTSFPILGTVLGPSYLDKA